jgi:hypothetical protein
MHQNVCSPDVCLDTCSGVQGAQQVAAIEGPHLLLLAPAIPGLLSLLLVLELMLSLLCHAATMHPDVMKHTVNNRMLGTLHLQLDASTALSCTAAVTCQSALLAELYRPAVPSLHHKIVGEVLQRAAGRSAAFQQYQEQVGCSTAAKLLLCSITSSSR